MSDRPRLSCQEAVEQLWAYIDGELPSEDADQVHDHLRACGACSPHHDYQRAFREFLRSHAGDRIPAELRRRIFLRLLEEEREAGTGGSTQRAQRAQRTDEGTE